MLAPLGIIAGLVVMILYSILRLKSMERTNQKKQDSLVDGIAAVDPERFPELAATFNRYVRESFGVDLAPMEFADHVRYVGKNLSKLRKRATAAHFPGGETEFAAAVVADLGELVIAQYQAHWIRDTEAPHFPFVQIEFQDHYKTFCNPAGAVVMQLIEGYGCGAFPTMLLPFEHPEQVQKKVIEIAGGYHADETKIELQLDQKLLKKIILTRRTAFGLMVGCILIPSLFLFLEPDEKSFRLMFLGAIAAVICGTILFRERWPMWRLVRYRSLVLYPDRFNLEGDCDALSIAYSDVVAWKTGRKPSGLTQGPPTAEFLRIKTRTERFQLLENYFTHYAAVREVFAEIARRIEAAPPADNQR